MSTPTKPCGLCGAEVPVGAVGSLTVLEHQLTPVPPGQLPARLLRVFCHKRHLAEWLTHPCHDMQPAGLVQLVPDPPEPPPSRPDLRVVR